MLSSGWLLCQPITVQSMKLLSSATLIRLGLGFSLSDKTEPHENCRTFKHIGCNFHPNSVHDYYQLEDRYKTIDWAVVIGPGHISDDNDTSLILPFICFG